MNGISKKRLIKKLTEANNYEYNLLKAAEECQELALALTQKALKPYKVKNEEITDEIGDVKIRLKMLENLFDKSTIKKRVNFKLNKFKGYLEKGKYGGRI